MDYGKLLRRALSAVPANGAARREIYAKARVALIQSLRNVSPPISAREITSERLRLEASIREIEHEAAIAKPLPPGPNLAARLPVTT